VRRLQTDVVVIGGGATGVGVLRDLAMRGFAGVLLERADLGQGTTSRFHGLLHSGGRYVVSDPHSASECAAENAIVSRIHAPAVELTGGLFVTAPGDDPGYADKFLTAAAATGVRAEEIPVAEALRREPRLNPGILRAIEVDDGAVDGWAMVWGAARSAQEYGSQLFPYHRVTGIETGNGRVQAVRAADLRSGEEVLVECGFVINAAGPWSGQVAALAGCHDVEVVPGRGIMIAMAHRLVNSVINRCIPPGDGDILVPGHTVCIIGTTDVKATDPDHLEIPPGEVQQMLDAGEVLVPGFRQARALHAWAGARPLMKDTRVKADDTRHMSRGMSILDHAERDGLAGFVSVIGGKLTTYRLMAEHVVDLMCEQLGERRACRTADEPVPGARGQANHRLGDRFAVREREHAEPAGEPLLCECEFVTKQAFIDLLSANPQASFDDLRRQLRLGMGPCQGGFCALRATGVAVETRKKTVAAANAALRQFLENRWIGLWPILYGDQLRQAVLDAWIQQGTLDVGHVPPTSPVRGAPAAGVDEPGISDDAGQQVMPDFVRRSRVPFGPRDDGVGSVISARTSSAWLGPRDDGVAVVVLGAGPAGLTAATKLARAGAEVTLVHAGLGGLPLSPGVIDVWGYAPGRIEQPLQQVAKAGVGHPYRLIGADAVRAGVEFFQELAQGLLAGDLEHNQVLPTAAGALRPACLAQPSMLGFREPAVIVGITGIRDFHAALIAENLGARHVVVKSPATQPGPLPFARAFADPGFRAIFANEVRPLIEDGESVGLPAVLGLNGMEGWLDLQEKLQAPVFEIPLPPPSIPGLRLQNALVAAAKAAGVRLVSGSKAIGFARQGERVTGIEVGTAGRPTLLACDAVVLASGGLESQGFSLDSAQVAGEPVFGLRVHCPAAGQVVSADFWADHPILYAGIQTDERMRPLGEGGRPAFENLFAAGGIIGGCNRIAELSGDGIALGSAWKAAEEVLR
jgi:glycerol-3-phosphate dehydrogenase